MEERICWRAKAWVQNALKNEHSQNCQTSDNLLTSNTNTKQIITKNNNTKLPDTVKQYSLQQINFHSPRGESAFGLILNYVQGRRCQKLNWCLFTALQKHYDTTDKWLYALFIRQCTIAFNSESTVNNRGCSPHCYCTNAPDTPDNLTSTCTGACIDDGLSCSGDCIN